MSITEVAVKRPLFITVVFTVLILFGFISYKQLSYNLLPKFEANVVSVMTTYRGAAADEVETNVTKHIEDAVSAIEGLDQINSTSQEGVSSVIIQLKQGISVDLAQQEAQRKVEQVISLLPDDADRPVINKFSTDEIPVLRMGVTANLSPSELYDLIDDKLKPQLSNVPGVGQVTIIGGTERQIQVNVNQEKLKAYHLSIGQISQAVNSANTSYPAGQVKTQDDQLSIRFDAKITTVDKIRNIIVGKSSTGGQIFLKDVAEIVDGIADATAVNHINGRPSVALQIQKQSDANAVEVSKFTRERLTKLEKQYESANLKFNIASDQSIYTLASADAVVFDLGLAVLIVSIVMLLFLHSFRSSLFILVALPSSMIPTFILMSALGFSLNLMTLMALSLVVGILVDDSIVVLENINRHLEMGKNKVQAALDGRSEIGFTALAITLVDVVVFVPLALTSGLIGNILREFSLVVVFSTLMSLMVSFTLTPLLASRFGKIEVLNPKSLWGKLNLGFEHFLDRVKEEYGRMLGWVLGHKRYIFLLSILLIVGSIALVPGGYIGASFMQQSDRGELSVTVEMAPTVSIYQTNQIAQKVEKLLLAKKEVTKVFTNVGYSNTGLGTTSNSNLANLTVQMVDKKQRNISAEDFGVMIQKEILQIPGVKVTVSPTSITGNANQSPIQVAIKGTDLPTIRKAAAEVKAIVESIPGTQNVDYSVDDPKPEVGVSLDREKMAQLGLNAAEVGVALQTAFRGDDRSKFKEKGREYDIMISLDKFDRSKADDIRQLSFVNSKGQTFDLSQFATIREGMGESVLQRIDRLSSITINSQAVGRPTGSIGADIQKKMEGYKLPEGISIEYRGDLKNQADAFGSLGQALILGILLIYLIMVALYESLVYPFVVLFSIPVALVGALTALALTMEGLTIFSIVGMIMLLGLVAKNAILIVDFTNQLKEEGFALKEALLEAGKERLRPILMTTIAMIAGMLPIALASGSGAEVKNGMAWVIIGGLTSSLMLTLFLVPSAYYVVDKIKARFAKPSRKKQKTELVAEA